MWQVRYMRVTEAQLRDLGGVGDRLGAGPAQHTCGQMRTHSGGMDAMPGSVALHAGPSPGPVGCPFTAAIVANAAASSASRCSRL
eukprot:363751-Chlamydomonas_euryale.AAC.4